MKSALIIGSYRGIRFFFLTSELIVMSLTTVFMPENVMSIRARIISWQQHDIILSQMPGPTFAIASALTRKKQQ